MRKLTREQRTTLAHVLVLPPSSSHPGKTCALTSSFIIIHLKEEDSVVRGNGPPEIQQSMKLGRVDNEHSKIHVVYILPFTAYLSEYLRYLFWTTSRD